MNHSALNRTIKQLARPAVDICTILRDAGFQAYIVGGAIRDIVRGVTPDDYDLATSALPDQVSGLFRRVVPTGVTHGTVTVLMKDLSVEVTTFRTESSYADGRHPDSVGFGATIHEDLSRRDFTINGMALDPLARVFLDPYSGEEDLKRGCIRAIGDADARFAEDALRLLRAVRFATQLQFSIEESTWGALCNHANAIDRISVERVRVELTKIVQSEVPSPGFRLLQESALLPLIIPELCAGVGVEQRGRHLFDVFEHSIRSCDAAPADDLVVRLAALLHDIGKPSALCVDAEGNRTFFGHDQLSADQSELLLRRLTYPNAVIARVTHLIRNHMFAYGPEWTDAAVRRFLARVGVENLEPLFALREADSFAQRGEPGSALSLAAFRERIDQILASEHALSRRDLAVNGHDLRKIGIPSGQAMGTVLEHLFETVLDDPEQNTRDRMLAIAESFYKSRLDQAHEE